MSERINLEWLKSGYSEWKEANTKRWNDLRFHRQAAFHDWRIPRQIRINVLTRSNGRCEALGCDDRGIEMHHMNYPGYGYETEDDLMLLCRRHHKEMHGIG